MLKICPLGTAHSPTPGAQPSSSSSSQPSSGLMVRIALATVRHDEVPSGLGCTSSHDETCLLFSTGGS